MYRSGLSSRQQFVLNDIKMASKMAKQKVEMYLKKKTHSENYSVIFVTKVGTKKFTQLVVMRFQFAD